MARWFDRTNFSASFDIEPAKTKERRSKGSSATHQKGTRQVPTNREGRGHPCPISQCTRRREIGPLMCPAVDRARQKSRFTQNPDAWQPPSRGNLRPSLTINRESIQLLVRLTDPKELIAGAYVDHAVYHCWPTANRATGVELP